jgi:hypothetical protein
MGWEVVGNVRSGSKADICSAQAHVRFTPESGHVRSNWPCLLWASSGHAADAPTYFSENKFDD